MQNELGAKVVRGIGKYFKGMITSETVNLEIGSRGSYGIEMTTLQENQVISVLAPWPSDGGSYYGPGGRR